MTSNAHSDDLVALSTELCTDGISMTRVVYDDQAFVMQRRGGISRYFVEIMKLLPTVDPELNAGYPGRWTLNHHAADAQLAKPFPGLQALDGSALPSRIARGVAQRAFSHRPIRTTGRADVYHPTYYAKSRFRTTQAPVVVTVYDMIPEILPQLFARNPHKEKHWYLQRADAIIAISQSTADDVRNLLPDIETPMTVIPLAVSHQHFTAVGPRVDNFPRPWVLFVGKRSGYKDFEVLLHAVAASSARIHVVAAGGGYPKRDEVALMEQLAFTDRVSFVQPDDDQLAVLYRSTDAFVFPSRYEGFGLPTLEAMASGAPVVLARTSSHPEVGGEAARYFTAGDSEELAAQLEHILFDHELSAALRARSLLRASDFSWEVTARMTAGLYRELIG